jgi:SRSO17 transposase
MESVQEWAAELEQIHRRIARRFVRPEPRERALSYLKGLTGTVERKNGWQLAEAAGEASPDGMQRLLNTAEWDANAVRDDLREYVVEHLGDDAGGVLIVDETGFLKKGEKSVGVKRQYTGTAGKTENCQVGVFVAYASNKGAAFIDRALYLPKEWAKDKGRREQAGIPEEEEFATKPAMARQMLKRAFDAGVRAGWVTGDTIYGSDRRLRMFLEERNQPFVLAVKSDESLWTLEERGPRQLRAEKIAKGVKLEDWRSLSAGAGSKGERLYEWALLPLFRLQLSEEERYWGHWLLVRRNVEDPEEVAYYIVFAPKETTTLEELVRVAGTRWRVESCFEQAKDGFGLAEYEVRKWEGWHRHVTICLLAHAFVCVVRYEEIRRGTSAGDLLSLTVPEVRRLLYRLLVVARMPREEKVLAWSSWRRRQLRAKRCHYCRRGATLEENSQG